LVVFVVAAAAVPNGVEQEKKRPTFAEVKQAVEATLESFPNYKPGRLVVQGQVKRVFEVVRERGWDIPGQGNLLKRIVADGDWLAITLYSEHGRRFMDKVATFPEGYDRLDRLSRIPRGKQTIRDLLRNPGGFTLIQYMTETPQGRNMGRMLSRTPGGAGFNAPTGRMYTAKQLLDELKRAYES
jgi:hypothetical protein